MRILFTGGGTGGHIFPIIAIKESFENQDGEFDFYYLGPDGFAKEGLKNQGIKTRFISAGKLRRYFSLETPLDIMKTLFGIVQCSWNLFFWVPDVIFSKGGYGSFPVVFVGWIYRIPIILHDSDSAPGLANRVLARFAKKIILSFPGSEIYFQKYQQKIILIGNPPRKELLGGDESKGKEIFKISSEKPVLLVAGGSQGAEKINQTILNILPRLLELAEVIHITGDKNIRAISSEAKANLQSYKNLSQFYHPYAFLNAEQLKHAYALTDLIINRSGAGSIFEIAACGKPSILIPLPSSTSDHQRKNAHIFSQSGGTIILEQENLTPNIFLEQISRLLKNPAKLKEMGEKAKMFYNPNTAEMIKQEIIGIIQ